MQKDNKTNLSLKGPKSNKPKQRGASTSSKTVTIQVKRKRLLSKKTDEIKFVIKDKEDFRWAEEKVKFYNLDKTNPVIFSPVFNDLKYETLAIWVKSSKLNIRMQIQLHKHIWSPELKGV